MSTAEKPEAHSTPDTSLRVGPLTNVAALLRSLGCEPDPVFEATGLHPQQFLDPNDQIDYLAAANLLSACVEATGCGHFGLLLGQWFLTSHLGIAGRLAETGPDVATALRDIVDNLDLHDRGAIATLETSGGYTTLGYAVTLPGVDAVEQVYDLSVSNGLGIMRSLCGMDWTPAKVNLSRAKPEDTRPYRAYFRAPVQFDALESSIIFPNRWLEHPLATADAWYHEQLVKNAHRLHDALPASLGVKVRNTLRRDLVGGAHTAAAVARQFGLHERTLHRRLRAEGTSFRTLLDEVRCAVSQHYLAGTALPVSDIALALGYGSPDAFDHAFRRWLGMNPRQWRGLRPRPGQH